MRYFIQLLLLIILASNCQNKDSKLDTVSPPILGKHKNIIINGKDTMVYHSIPKFELTNQYNQPFGTPDLEGKIYLTEFFFTSCPSVCPKVAIQMEQIHQDLQHESKFALLSITLDAKRDTPERLFKYAEKKEANHSNWFFLNGEKDFVYTLAHEGFYVAAYEDENRNNDNIMHDGILALIDTEGHIRGMYDGKDKKTVEKIKRDVQALLN